MNEFRSINSLQSSYFDESIQLVELHLNNEVLMSMMNVKHAHKR